MLTNIVTNPVMTGKDKVVKIQVNDNNKYYFTNEEIEKFISEDSEFRVVNLSEVPPILLKYF